MVDAIGKPDALPLYSQVRDIFVGRINSGSWSPGQWLPSENQLASELGVSQGTVRKALDALADASIVERRQGRGTMVVEHTPAHVLFKFFQLYDMDGKRILPGTGKTRFGVRKATVQLAKSLSILDHDDVIEINRVRLLKSKPIMVEKIYLPLERFPGFERNKQLPNTLYDFFQRDYGITISHVEEDLTAVAATKAQAAKLSVGIGAPLMKIDRVAYDIEGLSVERRISYCLTDGIKYKAKLS